jgi:hypothetical protein
MWIHVVGLGRTPRVWFATGAEGLDAPVAICFFFAVVILRIEVVVAPGRRLGAWHDPCDVRILSRRRLLARLAAPTVFEAPSLLLLTFFLARTLARALILRGTGLLHGASES